MIKLPSSVVELNNHTKVPQTNKIELISGKNQSDSKREIRFLILSESEHNCCTIKLSNIKYCHFNETY